jgi:hypothetical protein
MELRFENPKRRVADDFVTKLRLFNLIIFSMNKLVLLLT